MILDPVRHQKPGQLGRQTEDRCGTPNGPCRDETWSAGTTDKGSGRGHLLAQALTRENLQRAWQRVRQNGGSAGVDGLSIAETAEWLKRHWPEVKAALLAERYRPSPVRRVMIRKAGGGERELGIPTVLDRLIQQALLQVLQPQLDGGFSEHSYGFRPGRSAHGAIAAARAHLMAGYRIVVDVDLEKFFDRVDHDTLMGRLARKVTDPAVLRLVRRYLQAGVMVEGELQQRTMGTPQGGPLSPLLANVLLDEVDKRLEQRGHRFVRYADDCNIYVRSYRAGERVLGWLRRLYGRLKLSVNEGKTAVAHYRGRKFLGYAFVWSRGQIRPTVAQSSLKRLRERLWQLTQRTQGRSLSSIVSDVRRYLLGWKAYFQLVETREPLLLHDQWLRRRLRMVHLVHWKHGRRAYRALRRLGASERIAATGAKGVRHWWAGARNNLHTILTIAYFDRLGIPRLA